MSVEIRELVIQARLQENEAAGPDKLSNGSGVDKKKEKEAEEDEDYEADKEPSPEWMEQVVEQCIARLQHWLTEKSIR